MLLRQQVAGIRRGFHLSVYTFSKRFSSLSNEPPFEENVVSSIDVRQVVDDVCRVLERGPWGPTLENALSALDKTPQSESVIGVLRMLKDVSLALNYFRWCEKQTDQAHCPKAYNSLLMVMARSRNLNYLEQVLEEMSVAGIGLFNTTCIELVVSYIRSQKLKDGFNILQTMRKFKFRPAFSAYTTLIGALSTVPESDLMLTLFHQMQELGYEVTVHLFTTIICVFAKE